MFQNVDWHNISVCACVCVCACVRACVRSCVCVFTYLTLTSIFPQWCEDLLSSLQANWLLLLQKLVDIPSTKT